MPQANLLRHHPGPAVLCRDIAMQHCPDQIAWRAIVQVLLAPDADDGAGLKPGDLATLVLAGGGRCVAQRGVPFSSLAALLCSADAAARPDVAIFNPEGKHAHERTRLRRAGVPCLGPLFLVEWVTHPWANLASSHFGGNVEVPARLLSLMMQRSVALAAMSQSI